MVSSFVLRKSELGLFEDLSRSPVVVFPGGKPPIGLCQQTYCNPGDEIIYPSPGFPIYESFTRYVGGVPVPLHLKEEKGFSLDGEDLEPLITDRTKIVRPSVAARAPAARSDASTPGPVRRVPPR